MDKNVILAKKYGRAIYEIAAEQNSLEKTEEELHLIADAIKEHADLKELLFHPLLAKDVKKDTIKKLFADKVQPVVLQFCYVVIDRDRITDFPAMVDVYTTLAHHGMGIEEAVVTSALPRTHSGQYARVGEDRSLAWWNCAVGVSVETCEQNHDRRQREKILLLGACAGRNRHSETDLRFVYAIGFSDSRGGRASPQKNQDKAGKELFTLCNQGNPSKSCVHGGR